MLSIHELEEYGYIFDYMGDGYCTVTNREDFTTSIVTIKEAVVLANSDHENKSLNKYQAKSRDTYHEVKVSGGLPYLTLGLVGEVGEFSNKLKKVYRDKNGIIDATDIKDFKDELGDVLWYLTNICTNLGLTLDDVAARNIKKLQDRKKRGVISGSGDNR